MVVRMRHMTSRMPSVIGFMLRMTGFMLCMSAFMLRMSAFMLRASGFMLFLSRRIRSVAQFMLAATADWLCPVRFCQCPNRQRAENAHSEACFRLAALPTVRPWCSELPNLSPFPLLRQATGSVCFWLPLRSS